MAIYYLWKEARHTWIYHCRGRDRRLSIPVTFRFHYWAISVSYYWWREHSRGETHEISIVDKVSKPNFGFLQSHLCCASELKRNHYDAKQAEDQNRYSGRHDVSEQYIPCRNINNTIFLDDTMTSISYLNTIFTMISHYIQSWYHLKSPILSLLLSSTFPIWLSTPPNMTTGITHLIITMYKRSFDTC